MEDFFSGFRSDLRRPLDGKAFFTYVEDEESHHIKQGDSVDLSYHIPH